jgi:ATP-binding cassette, subfamily C, bacterial LapB
MKELLLLLRARPLLAVELLIASLFINVLGLTPPLFFILVFNRYVSSGFDGTLITLTTGMVLAVILKFLFGLARNRLAEEVTGDRDPLRMVQAFQVLLRARIAPLVRQPKTQLMEAVQAPQISQSACSPQNIAAILDAPFAILSVILVFMLSFELGLVTAVALMVTAILSILGQRASRKPMREIGESVAAGRQMAAQVLQDPDTVRAFGCRSFLLGAWDEHVRRMQTLRRIAFRSESMSQGSLEAAALFTRAAVIAIGAHLVVHGELTVGALIGASFLAGMPISIFSRFFRASSALNAAQEQTEKFRQLATLPLEADKGLAVDKFKGRLEFSDLAFAWPGAPGPLFESLSLQLDAGGFLAVSGRNGTGKTTLARLLAGLLDPGRGQIMIDGLDLRQVAPEWWRRQLVYLPQEPSFIKASVLENIRLAGPDMKDEDLGRVMAQAGLKPFLNAHPQGAEMIVEDGGRTLSPGIRRRLALARALATDGQMVVLDDPTESLDTEGCKTVLEVIRDLNARKKTLVVFSNDVRILAMADMYLDLNAKPVPRVTLPGQKQEGKP